MDGGDQAQVQYIRSRISNACDGCKARKVKCDGKSPCSYCVRRQCPLACHYSPQKRRTLQHQTSPPQQQPKECSHDASPTTVTPNGSTLGTAVKVSTEIENDRPVTRDSLDQTADEEADVPREARLLRDAQGRLVFIGDCAPLAFYQSARQILINYVDANAFAMQANHRSVLASTRPSGAAYSFGLQQSAPHVALERIDSQVQSYLTITAGLVDLFDNTKLPVEIKNWAVSGAQGDLLSLVYYLVLAIGALPDDEEKAQTYFEFARDRAFGGLSGDVSVSTVHAFVLIALYMLNVCQINDAFLFFGVAVRSAYAIGVHRTEVNARFGPEAAKQRDHLWKSLRVVDLFLSSSMGRPPATSDEDCTVPYRTVDHQGEPTHSLLDASVQIMLVMESVVVEVYSRRKISLAVCEGISSQLRDWSTRWVPLLREFLSPRTTASDATTVNAACHVSATYFYAVILVSRPFLMYELCRKLSEAMPQARVANANMNSGKTKLADACIDAASLMTEAITDLISRGSLPRRAPVLVSWLFAASLVLGLGLLGGFGRILEKFARAAISGLEFFAETDAHAEQYAIIARSLLTSALGYLEKKDMNERMQRTLSSRQLFGLIAQGTSLRDNAQSRLIPQSTGHDGSRDQEQSGSHSHGTTYTGYGMPDMQDHNVGPGHMIDPNASWQQIPDLSIFEGLLETGSYSDDRDWNGLNMFSLLGQESHVDLTHYF